MHHADFDACDLQRLRHAVNYARHASHTPLDVLLPPWIPGDLKRAIRAECTVSHCGILLFPPTVEAALAHFRRSGWRAAEPIPSVLVKRRLMERHGLPDDTGVWVTRVRPAAGPQVEVFLFPTSCRRFAPQIAEEERTHGFENHVGLFMGRARGDSLRYLAERLEDDGQLVFEGSAHNPHENTTMVYFAPGARVATARRRFPRWEVQCPGDLTSAVKDRPVREAALAEAYAALRDNSRPRVAAPLG
ncbi:hypothetical protein C6N75_25370 [Streptomyces solincola]|uniref:Uncharacterized protein n=1 Tax=Streptomyces solincola TaxID=2100817 RepID=A0A2S9PQ65_9ACTN|nr:MULTISPECIES: hypothetical protein [Streptomyces]PRH76487.1 hypothetical protein C6N75_25370 [Streptomyces solincola]